MKKEEIQTLFKSFEEAVCKVDETECWSARNIQKLLGYSLWQNFCKVISKAKDSCINVGQNVQDHFIDVNNMVALCSTAKNGAIFPKKDFYPLPSFAFFMDFYIYLGSKI